MKYKVFYRLNAIAFNEFFDIEDPGDLDEKFYIAEAIWELYEMDVDWDSALSAILTDQAGKLYTLAWNAISNVWEMTRK